MQGGRGDRKSLFFLGLLSHLEFSRGKEMYTWFYNMVPALHEFTPCNSEGGRSMTTRFHEIRQETWELR